MRFESRTWFLLSLLLFAGAIYFWKRGNEYELRKNKAQPQLRRDPVTNGPAVQNNPASTPIKLLTQLGTNGTAGLLATSARPSPVPRQNNALNGSVPPSRPATENFPLRLSNTAKSAGQLARVETALLMRNAFIDTAENPVLDIPAHLRAEGDPGSYIIQARGPIQAAFRQHLRDAGASIVAYIPNNAYLVQTTAQGAQQMSVLAETQAVLPYEPYYKLDSELLKLAVKQEPLAQNQWLRVTAFPGTQEALANSVATLGGEILGEERTPFGPQLLIKPTTDSLPAIAKLASVQIVELFHGRELLNDQTRVVVGIATNGSTGQNYLNLTGTNVLINLNDTGVDSTHPDLQGRVFGDTSLILSDIPAHGTHVAGIIAGSGLQSSSVASAPGSDPNPNFRGMAPAAQLFVLPFKAFPEVNAALDDSYLQETAARTNATMSRRRSGPMISNNSWGNVGANEYDSSSARFDAAVRDAVPDITGMQPMIFVFAAGNSGEGSDNGLEGEANSIPSPGNAKNVITVGATEHLRFITNSVLSTNLDGSISTNMLFFEMTDSNDQLAAFSSRGNVGIGIEGDFGRFKPDLVAPGSFIISPRSKAWRLENDYDTNSPQYMILKEANDPLAPYYRYESGTSQAAPVVSGVLALMQEYFEQRLAGNLRRTNSPALMKALLINGARSLSSSYDLNVQNSINYQGWGLVNITNTIPAALSTLPEAGWPMRLIDQTPTNALATGQSKSWSVGLTTNAQDAPLRVTLVWTDPPGNPTAAIKLVNDLDLVVSNTVSGEVFYGNDIRTQSDYSHASFADEPAFSDAVNNVENVFIREPGSSNFVVSVIAKRVNVSAAPDYNQVTARVNDVVQDYALVIACGDSTLTNVLTVTPITPVFPAATVTAVPMTNGVPLINQRVGANPSLNSASAGVTNQWNFYVFTNVFVTNEISSLTNGTNVAFVTYLPPNVGEPRLLSADIDLYVTKDPTLVNLNPAAVDTAFKSTSRGGTEFVVFTNAAIGDVFYIGVKSEDQQSGEYGLIALSTEQPFDQDKNGKRVLNGLPVPQKIPDGTPAKPGFATIIAIGITPVTVKNVTVENVLTHQDVGDLSISLTHERDTVVLHNHTLNNGFPGVTNSAFIYDDQNFSISGTPRHSDGPGTLNSFAGAQSTGVWMVNFVDNAPGKTGSVETVTIEIDPFVNGDLNLAGSGGIDGTVPGHDAACYFVDSPPEATNMVIAVTQLSGDVILYLDHGSIPTTNSYRKSVPLTQPGGVVTIGANDEPIPLEAGRYFICLYNPNDGEVRFHLAVTFQLGVGLDYKRTLVGTNVTLLDDGLVQSVVNVPVDKEVADVQVAVRIEHPRSSDLVLHLISPQGTSLLLAENRGGIDSHGYGAGFGTNLTYTVFTEDTNLVPNLTPIKFALPPWNGVGGASTNVATFQDSFENALPGTYVTNQSFSGWSVLKGEVLVHGPGNILGLTAHTGTNFLELDTTRSPAAITTSFGTVPGKEYQLSFFFQRNPGAPLGTLHALQVYYGEPVDLPSPSKFINVPSFGWQSTNIVFTATSATTELVFASLSAVGPLLDTVVVGDVVNATNIYVLPEESLTLFQGQRAYGDWTLEVLDNRLGPPGAGRGTLINWELQLKYGNPPGRATPLTNGLAFSGSLTNNQTNYFVVDVCDSANLAFATLLGDYNKLNLLVNRSGIPTGDFDDFAPIPNDLPLDESFVTGVAAFTLDSDPHQPAPLEPGQRLYFAVHNLNLGETNSYSFQVSFDRDTCTRNRPIIPLENDVPYTNIVAPSRSLFDYYVFTVSPAAIHGEFEVRPRNGDLGLVLSYGLPLPNLNAFDYRSDNPGIANELIVLTNTSSPVSLQPGDWYLGVYNNSTNAVVYDVRASEILDTNLNIVILTNAIPLDFAIAQNAKLTNYFLFKVPTAVPGLKFELYNLNAAADLFIGYNLLPSPTTYFLSNTASPSSPISIEIRTNSRLPEVRGNWMLQVVPKQPTNLVFTLKASYFGLTNSVPSTNRYFDPTITVSTTNICFSWPTTPGLEYELQGVKSLVETNWTTLYGPVTATGTNMNYCLDLPTEYSFFRVSEKQSGTEPPATGTIINPALTVSATNLCLSWPSTVGSIYLVQGKPDVMTASWTNLTGPITATSTTSSFCLALPSPYNFFQVIENPGGSTEPPPSSAGLIDPALSFGTNGLCLTWPSQSGVLYDVQAKLAITDPAWTNILGPITATGPSTTECLPKTTPYHFFQISRRGSGSGTGTGTGTGTNDVSLRALTLLADGRIQFTWDTVAAASYEVQFTTNLLPVIRWTTLTNLTPTGATATVTDTNRVSNGVMRFYRIVKH